MSYLDFDYESNSILVCKGSAKNKDKIKPLKKHDSFIEFYLNDEFNGVKIPQFLSKYEQDGIKGELKFKELLDKNSIPFLYIGQGPFGIERSGILIDEMKSKRADFLVNIKDMGTILFDAKCRRRIGFHNSGENYFSLFTEEIERLRNLQDSILMPVWLAFTDRDLIDSTSNPVFYFISISTIVQYWSGLFNYFSSENEFKNVKVIRIPNSLLTKIEDKIIFEVGHLRIEEELLNEYAKKCIGFSRLVKDKIKEVIRNKNCYKSRMYEELKSVRIDFCYPYEVNSFIETMISQNIIKYEPKKYLKLVGE